MKTVFNCLFRVVFSALVLFATAAHGAECTEVFSDTSGVNENLPGGTRLTFDTDDWKNDPVAPDVRTEWPASGTELSTSGDYYFEEDKLEGSYSLTVAPDAAVRIFVDGDMKFEDTAALNSSGTPDQLQLFVDGKIDVKDNALIRGRVYATNKLKVENNARIEGLVLADDKLDVKDNAVIRGVVYATKDLKVEDDALIEGVTGSEKKTEIKDNGTVSVDNSAVNQRLLSGLCEPPGAVTLPVVDTFESYSPGSIDGLSGGTGWGGPWSGLAGQALVDTSADPLLFQADNGLSIRSLTTLEISDNDNRIATRPLDGTFTGDSLYMSMLVRFEGTPGNNDFLAFWVQSPGFGDSPQFGVKVNEGGGGTDDFFVRLDTNADYSTDLVPGQTYLLVAQFEKDGTGYFNRGRLWVDPQCTDAPPATSASVARNPSSEVTEISEIGLRSANLGGGELIQVGQIAAGEQWTDVVQCQCLDNGLEATFYNDYNSDDPFPSDPDLTRLDPQVDFNWINGSPDPAIDNNNFAVQWQGSIEVPETGNYRFRTRTDDGVRLWVDDTQVIDDWQDHAAQNRDTGDIFLEAGVRYSIRMQFYENGGQASAVLSWLRPGSGSYEVIPEEYLFACLPVTPPQLLSGVAECGAASLVTLEFSQTERTRELASALANNPANYKVESLATGTGIAVQAATLGASGYTVQLDLAAALEEGETYEVTASNLKDASGLAMDPSPSSVEVSAQSTGLTATYWNNRFLNGEPVVSRNEANINNSWGRGSPIPGTINNDLFSVRWTGYILAPESGTYRFRTRTDDGVRLWVNDMGSPIINEWVNQSPTNHTSGTVTLEEGEFYEIRMEMYENRGGAVAQLRWETPDAGGFVIVPGSALFNCPENVTNLDHFRISHGGSAVTCQPSPVTIEAMNADGVPVADYEGTVTISTSTGNGDWLDAGASAGTLSPGSGNSGAASYSFVPADGGVITLDLSHTVAQTVNVDLDDEGTGELPEFDPDILFDETGFIFHEGADLVSLIPGQVAGRPSTTSPGAQDLRLTAVRTNDDTGACEAFLTGPQDIDLGYVCDNPGSCALSNAVTVNGSTVASNDSGGLANSSLVTFDFGDDTETSASLTLTHADAGRISLFAQLALEDAEGNPTGEVLTGSSNLFVAVPAGFCIEAIDPASECAGDPAQCSVFTTAGSDFDVRYRAKAWQADGESGTDFCTGNSTTPGFERSALELGHELLAPAVGEEGAMGLAQVNFGTPQQGDTTMPQSLTEVGVFELQVVPGQTWLGTTLPGGESAPIGRLTPASFSVAVTDAGTLAPACEVSNGFLYSGQQTGWEIEPELLVIALNTLGDITTNYTRGDFLKLAAGDVTRVMPDEDSVQMDAATPPALMNLVFAEQTGTLAPFPDPDDQGQMTYRFSAADALSYPKSDLSIVAPFDPDLSFGVTQVQDSDGIAASTALPLDFTPVADFELRYGRLALANVYGPETIAELQMPFQAEYWNGDRFVPNADDGCWAWTTTDISNSDSHSSLQADSGILVNGEGTLRLVPDGSQGTDTLNWTVPDWLKDFWTEGGGLENPSAFATFGVYRGNDRVIYWQER